MLNEHHVYNYLYNIGHTNCSVYYYNTNATILERSMLYEQVWDIGFDSRIRPNSLLIKEINKKQII